jgi:hypothetical protein
VNKLELVCLLTLRGRLGAQPQGDVGRLHRLPHHTHQFFVQRFEVRIFANLDEKASRVFLASYLRL